MRINLLLYVSLLYDKLKKAGVVFSRSGFPIFKEDMILQEVPRNIVTYAKRNLAKDRATTLLCFFLEDKDLYRRLQTIDADMDEYRSFLGVGGMDLSANILWPIEQQRLNILINQLFMAYLAINGVKIVPNWRIGDFDTIQALSSYPKNTQFIVGTLATSECPTSFEIQMLKAKVYLSMPALLLIYGKIRPEIEIELNSLGVNYVHFDDYMTCRDRERRCA